MGVRFWPAAATAAALALGGCGSSRLGGPTLTGATPRPVASAPVASPLPQPVEPMPSGPVTSEPLPPLPGAPGPVASIAPGPATADVPVMPGSPRPVESLAPRQDPYVAPAPAAAAPAARSGFVGGWTAREASGTSCRVQLASTSALDLYKASASGCANKDLARVSAWDFRDGELFLYQPGGAVAARLRASGSSLEGVLTKSGAPIALAR